MDVSHSGGARRRVEGDGDAWRDANRELGPLLHDAVDLQRGSNILQLQKFRCAHHSHCGGEVHENLHLLVQGAQLRCNRREVVRVCLQFRCIYSTEPLLRLIDLALQAKRA